MTLQNIWRSLAVVLCAALPASFYVLGDITDAFPGVLTLRSDSAAPTAAPPAQAESYDREAPTSLVPPTPEALPQGFAEDLQQRMDQHADLPAVDGNLAYAVVDAGSGEVIAARDAATAHVPASTTKLLTAAATLRLMPGDSVLHTTAELSGNTLTLIGGGDMMLSEEKLAGLADETVTMIDAQDAGPVSLVLDDTLLVGGTNPAWGGNGPAGGWVAPTAALAIEQGSLDGQQYGAKSADPAADAAERFAELLAERGVEITGEITRGEAPGDGTTVHVESAPVRAIVQHTLMISDNTTAELLAHLVALARGEEPTPAGAAAAVEAEITELAAELDVPAGDLAALELHDGSGLSSLNRVPPRLLAEVLGDVASGEAPELAPLLYDIPVAGLSGTLYDRFEDESVQEARGQVRGKTGYLGGAATLAGVTTFPDGRTASYSIVVHGFDGPQAPQAEAAVDQVAAEIGQQP